MPVNFQPPSISDNGIFGNPVFGGALESLAANLGITKANAGFLVTDPDFPSSRKRLDIKYFSSDNVEKVSANYNPIKVLGRSSPIQMYSDGNAVNMNFTCWFIAEGSLSVNDVSNFLTSPSLDLLTKSGIIQKEVLDPVSWLKSLVFPVSRNGISYPPTSPIFIFGDFIAMRVFVNDVTVTYVNVVDTAKLSPLYAKVEVSMIQNTNDISAYTQSDVEKGRDRKTTFQKQINFSPITFGSAPSFLGLL